MNGLNLKYIQRKELEVCVCVCVCVYTYMYIYTCSYMYVLACTYMYLLIELQHGTGQGVHSGRAAPHWVGGQGVPQHWVQVGPVHCLQLVPVWVATRRERERVCLVL